MSSSDFYELLELSRNCSQAEIKSSYKKLVRKYHPDNRETGNEELFKLISEAYTVLSDPQKKDIYDRVGHEAYTQASRGGGYSPGYASEDIFGDLQDVFDTFFGAGTTKKGKRNRKVRGSDIQLVVELDFVDAVFGGSRKINLSRFVTCKTCDGSGADPAVGVKTCTNCGGTGEIRKVTQSFLGMITQVQACPVCNGTGHIIPSPCKTCNGKGQVKSEQELEVKVPKGAEDGSRLIWSQKGNEGKNGGPSGDLYLLIRVKPHERLRRQGLEIFEERNISIWQAIVGDELQIETVHGNHVVELKPGTQPNTVITINGSGVRLDNGQTGSHHVKINVEVPNKKDLPKEVLDVIQERILDKKDDKGPTAAFANFFRKGK
jgi:molecular chaperone DnaJ